MTERERVDVVIVGAGVVGLAVAAELSARRCRVVVVERHDTFGEETSSRSSEVVHGGLYYARGSLKAELCLEGAVAVHERAARLGIPLSKLGKVVVAADAEELGPLEALFERASSCGARDLELWSGSRLAAEEPRLAAAGALWSPWTAVVDSVELMRSYLVEAREAGAEVVFRHTLLGLEPGDGARPWVATLDDPSGERVEVEATAVVNAAGLASGRVAALAGIDVAAAGYVIHPCKGDYFSIRRGAVQGIRHLVYPLPEANEKGLGVHLTFDVAGDARLGPDAAYVDDETDYSVDESKGEIFLASGRRLFPWLEGSDIAPERAGIRPKLAAAGEPSRDFVVCHEADRGLPGLVDLVGIESPGLTSAPAIARRVAVLLEGAGIL